MRIPPFYGNKVGAKVMTSGLSEDHKLRLVETEAMRAAVRLCLRKGLYGTELTRFLTTRFFVDLDLLSEVLAEIQAETTSQAA